MSGSTDSGGLPAVALPAHHDSRATIYFALIANAVIALAKGFAAWFTGSTSMLAGVKLDLASARIMVCGNPEMNRELRALLTARGLRTNRRAAPGQLAFENYWASKPT